MNLFEKYEQVQQLNIEQSVIEGFESSLDDFTIEQKKQLLAGYDGTGSLIGDKEPYVNAQYAFEKYRLNPLPGLGNPDLNLTGDFQGPLDSKLQGDTVVIDSPDSKTPELEAKYGTIFGLAGDFRQSFIDESLRPNIIINVREKIGL